MAMTPEVFAQKIKQKYPQYADMDDLELTAKIIDKYPAYRDQVETKESLMTRASSFWNKTKEVEKDLGVGVLKGAASTVKNIGDFGAKYGPTGLAEKAYQAVTGKETPLSKLATEEGDASLEKMIEPEGIAQSIGFGAEQIGEFFIPGGAVAKGTKAVEVASGGSKLAGLGARVALEAGSAGAVTAAQGGTSEESATNAAIAGAIPVVGGLVGKAAGPLKSYLAEKVSPKLINSLVKPVSKEFEFGRNAGKGVVSEGITANTKGELLTKLTDKKKEIGNEISVVLSTPEATSKVIDISQSLKPIDEAIAKAAKSGEQALYDRLISLKNGMTKNFEEVEGRLTAPSDRVLQMSPADARKLKTELGEATKWSGQPFDNDVNQARVAVYRAINNQIDEAVPGVKALNARYADMLSAERALDRTLKLGERQNIVPLGQAIVGSATGAASLASGDSSPEAMVKALAGGLLLKAAGSTAAKTRLAKALGGLSPEERTVISKSIPFLRNFFMGLEEKGME